MRIAAYNVENLFSRPRVMGAPEPVAAAILDAHARVNELFDHDTYSAADKAEILTLLKKLRLLLNDGEPNDEDTFAVLRKIRGQLLKRPAGGDEDDVTVVADGRSDWVGWVDLIKDRIDALAITHTARVIREVGADIVGVVEAEDRITLRRFSDTLIHSNGVPRYPHVMLIDGNDTRGIDVGILSTDQYPVSDIRTHVDDGPFGNRIFSRDCPEYRFTFSDDSALAGQSLLVLVNHLKSKFGSNQTASNKRRRRQAEAVAQIYRRRRDEGIEHVVVLGDFNDTPDSNPLHPLLAETDLTDIAQTSNFDDGDPDEDRPGTFGNGTKSNKIDYLLLSPSLFDRVTGGGIFRKGVWGGTHGTLFPHFDTMTSKVHAASDHAAIYADIDIS
ncbi:endonuclease/exonuclease/phosphatase family protein [Nocardia amamiensis]|uniref:Endonuclease/exonuclease/phosphatase family protein n=1 Tax=Nocardia amamiensis TaxID=404578 RepID=A0ABS0D4V0_9NOCA|nr:endonuclease/exonuclease/phosphatase family protein [Nocardia amamiensis]